MSFVIEKNVPMPSRSGRSATYPYADMEVGDSFFVPSEDKSKTVSASLRGSSYAYVKRNGGSGKRFSVRKSEDGFRVWRIA